MSVRELFERHRFAQGLSKEQTEILLGGARLVRFAEGSSIFREGKAASHLYLIVTGRVALEQHVPGKGDFQLESLQANDMLGLSWLFPAREWLLDARAVEETEAVELDAEFVRNKMDEDPQLGLFLARHIIQQLYQRLERVRLQRLDVYRSER